MAAWVNLGADYWFSISRKPRFTWMLLPLISFRYSRELHAMPWSSKHATVFRSYLLGMLVIPATDFVSMGPSQKVAGPKKEAVASQQFKATVCLKS